MKNLIITDVGQASQRFATDNRLLSVWAELDELVAQLDGAERTLSVLSQQTPSCDDRDICATVGFVSDGVKSIKDRLSRQCHTLGEVARLIDNPYSTILH